MKNLKKSLALVLVLVLALGMVPFAAGASGPADMNVTDYPDFNSITEEQREAVDVLTALGVLQGDAGGFRPQDTITRAEAAKIIAYIRLGTSTAEALPVMTNNTFYDVPPSHWANKFVEYGATQGIISGHGDGNFSPEDQVTGIQIGKMLLTALGYGVNGEFEGPGWELAVIDRARMPDVRVLVGTGDDVDFSAPATREQVAQYTFNTLYVTRMVSWNSTINDYSFWSQTQAGQQNRPTLGNNTFRLGYDTRNNMYGFQGRVWWITTTSRELTPWYQTDAILGVSTNGTPIDTLNANSRSLTVRGRAGFVAELERGMSHYPATGTSLSVLDSVYQDGVLISAPVLEIFVNGEQIGTGEGGNTMSLDYVDAYRLAATPGVIVYLVDHLTSSEQRQDWTGNLPIQYWYEHNGRIDRVIIIAKTAHEAAGPPLIASNGNVTITGVTPRNLWYMLNTTNTEGRRRAAYDSGGGNVAVTIPENPPTDVFLTPRISDARSDTVIYPEGIERGDVLLVHTARIAGVRTTIVELADSVDGQMTDVRMAAPSNITFGGETFYQSGLTPTALFTGPGTPGLTLTGDWKQGYWSQDINDENHLFAMTRTGVSNLNVDATIWLDDNGDVIRARRVEPGDAVWGLITGFESDGVLQSSMQVRLTTSDGITDFFTVARRTNQTVRGIIDAIESISSESSMREPDDKASGFNATADPIIAALVAYNILDDGRVQLIFPGESSGQTAGIGDGSAYPAGSAVPRTSIATYASITSYSARRNDVVVNPGGTKYITGTTVVFYFDTEGLVRPGGDIGWHATNNPVTVGIGPSGASMDIENAVYTSYVTNQNGSLLQAIWINMKSDGRGTARWALLENSGSMRHMDIGGASVYDFDVWTMDNHTSSLRAETYITDEYGVRLADLNGNPYGVGLYEYTVNNRGIATVAPAPGNFPFGAGGSINSNTQITFANDGIIRYRGDTEQTLPNVPAASASITSLDGSYANLGPIRVDSNTRYFEVNLNPTRSAIVPPVAEYTPPRNWVPDLNIPENVINDYTGYFLLGIQLGERRTDPAIAVYFYRDNVLGTGSVIDLSGDITITRSGGLPASGTNLQASVSSIGLYGDVEGFALQSETVTWQPNLPTGQLAPHMGSDRWVLGSTLTSIIVLEASPGYSFPTTAALGDFNLMLNAPTFGTITATTSTLSNNYRTLRIELEYVITG